MAKKVFISAGHGGKDPGAVGSGMYEKNVNLQIALANGAELKRHGINVVFSRTVDENDPVTDEVKEANASKANLAISHHINSASSNKADGSESLYYPGSEDGKRLAELCEEEIKKLGQNSRGIKERGGLWFLKGTNMPAVITESFFINNPIDAAIGDTAAEQQAIGVAYAKAILRYFGITYKPVTTSAIIKKEEVKVEYAEKFNKSYAGTYKVTAKDGLNMRAGAGTKHKIITSLAKGKKVQCYGYYTKQSDGTIWLLVQVGKYTGFVSKKYLTK